MTIPIPHLPEFAHGALLHHTAHSSGSHDCRALYTAADDFKNFSNQLRLAPEEFWKCGMMLSRKGKAKFVSEYTMTFGLRPASNIARRFAEAIVAIWRRLLQEAELPYLKQAMERSEQFAKWVESRGGVASAAAQCSLFIYTGDPIFIILGAERYPSQRTYCTHTH